MRGPQAEAIQGRCVPGSVTTGKAGSGRLGHAEAPVLAVARHPAVEEQAERLGLDTEIREGGAAMTAYCKLQFEDMSEVERDEIKKALLRYCELDTLAMVMIYEAWREWIRSEPGAIATGFLSARIEQCGGSITSVGHLHAIAAENLSTSLLGLKTE